MEVTLPDTFVMAFVERGLPAQFNPVRNAILVSNCDPDDARTSIREAADQMRLEHKSKTPKPIKDEPPANDQDITLIGKERGRRTIRCSRCGSSNHKTNECKASQEVVDKYKAKAKQWNDMRTKF